MFDNYIYRGKRKKTAAIFLVRRKWEREREKWIETETVGVSRREKKM